MPCGFFHAALHHSPSRLVAKHFFDHLLILLVSRELFVPKMNSVFINIVGLGKQFSGRSTSMNCLVLGKGFVC